MSDALAYNLRMEGHTPIIALSAPAALEVARRERFDLVLLDLMLPPRSVLASDRLLHAVWGHEYVGERTVDVHVRRVRAKLEHAGSPRVIRTVHGVGYAFDPAPDEENAEA